MVPKAEYPVAQTSKQDYDYRICKACRKSTGRPAIRLTSGWVYECDECGFHYLDYLDAIEHDTEGIRGDAYSEELRCYLESQLQSNKERFQHHLAILTECGSVERKKVLDIGCGGGLFLSLARQAGAEVVGLELDDARAFHCTQVLGLDVVKHRIESEYWDGYAKTFDFVTLWDVIEHVNFPVETLSAAARLLRPGGRLLLDTPARDAFYYRFGELTYRLSAGRFPTFLNAMYLNKPYAHKQIISTTEMSAFLRRAGLDVVSLRKVHELSFPCSFYLRRLTRSELLARLLSPFAAVALKVVPIRNKMIVVAQAPV